MSYTCRYFSLILILQAGYIFPRRIIELNEFAYLYNTFHSRSFNQRTSSACWHFVTFCTKDKTSTSLFTPAADCAIGGRFFSRNLVETSSGSSRVCRDAMTIRSTSNSSISPSPILIERGHRSISGFQQSVVGGHSKRCTGPDSITMS